MATNQERAMGKISSAMGVLRVAHFALHNDAKEENAQDAEDAIRGAADLLGDAYGLLAEGAS